MERPLGCSGVPGYTEPVFGNRRTNNQRKGSDQIGKVQAACAEVVVRKVNRAKGGSLDDTGDTQSRRFVRDTESEEERNKQPTKDAQRMR